METPWLSDCKALLYAALGGQAGAGAVADALVGKGNPCGKLAETWPVQYEDVPSAAHFACKGKTVEYREGPYKGTGNNTKKQDHHFKQRPCGSLCPQPGGLVLQKQAGPFRPASAKNNACPQGLKF